MLSRSYDFIYALIIQLIRALRKVNRLVVTIVSIVVTIIILGILVYKQREILINFHWEFRPVPLFLAFLVYTVALFWVSVGWGWICNILGTQLSYWKHIRNYIVSNMAKRIPGTIWYVASRFQLYSAEGFSATTTAVASGIELVLITLAGIIVVLIFSTQTLLEYQISPVILVIVFILGLIVLHPKVIRWILARRKVDSSILSYKNILQGILYYIFSWIFGGVVLYEIGNIISPISINNLLYIINIWTLVGIISTLFFFSPSNFGITEIGLSLLLSKVVPTSIAVVMAVATRILLMVFEIIWASLFLWFKQHDSNRLTQKD